MRSGVTGPRYRPGMLPVFVDGVARPRLGSALAERGLAARAFAAGAVAALVPDGVPLPVCPVVIEARSGDEAGQLLDGGAADVVLATDPDALVAARLAALIRRLRPEVVRAGDIAIDTVERRVTVAGAPLALLPREYALLLFLARRVDQVVAHATLHRALWDRDFDPGTNVIAVHVSRLRGKLGGTGVTVVTERGRGYRLATGVAGRGQGG